MPEAKTPDKAEPKKSESKDGGAHTVTTKIFVPADAGGVSRVSKESLRDQAKIATRDAVPVAAYSEPTFRVIDTKADTVDGTAGKWWNVELVYTPLKGVAQEPVDLEKVIAESVAPPAIDAVKGDPDFLTKTDSFPAE